MAAPEEDTHLQPQRIVWSNRLCAVERGWEFREWVGAVSCLAPCSSGKVIMCLTLRCNRRAAAVAATQGAFKRLALALVLVRPSTCRCRLAVAQAHTVQRLNVLSCPRCVHLNRNLYLSHQVRACGRLCHHQRQTVHTSTHIFYCNALIEAAMHTLALPHEVSFSMHHIRRI